MGRRRVKRLVTRSSIFFAGAVVGIVIGLALSQVVIYTTIGAAVYNARVEQQAIDKKIFDEKLARWYLVD